MKFIDLLGLAHTDANGYWVGDKDSELDNGLYWNAQQQIWENRKNDSEAAGRVEPSSFEVFSPYYGQFVGEYGSWLRKNSREDGMVKDPRQSRIGSTFWPEWIDPTEFTYADFLMQAAQNQIEEMTPAVGGGVMRNVANKIAAETARSQAKSIAGKLKDKFVKASRGDMVGHSGGKGAAIKSASTALTQLANTVANPQLKAAMKIEAERLLQQAKGAGHK